MDALQKQQGIAWLRWHVRNKRNLYRESQDLETENQVLMILPSPPVSVSNYITSLEHKVELSKNVIRQFDTFTKMTTEGKGTDREREEFLSKAMEEMAYMIEQYPDMSPENEETELTDWY